MKVRLWIPDNQEVKIVIIKSIRQFGKDVCLELDNGDKYYLKGDYYHQVFEDAERLGYIKGVVKTLD
jgi:hypothetical protein